MVPHTATSTVRQTDNRDICLHWGTITCWLKGFQPAHHVAVIFFSLLEEMWIKLYTGKLKASFYTPA